MQSCEIFRETDNAIVHVSKGCVCVLKLLNLPHVPSETHLSQTEVRSMHSDVKLTESRSQRQDANSTAFVSQNTFRTSDSQRVHPIQLATDLYFQTIYCVTGEKHS